MIPAAAKEGCVYVVKFIVKHETVNSASEIRLTALFRAPKNGVHCLIAHGAS